jgi:transposase-like protein
VTKGANLWLSVKLTDLKNRGMEDILVACMNSTKGNPDAIAAEFPQTEVQLCIVHMVRNSPLRTWPQSSSISFERPSASSRMRS